MDKMAVLGELSLGHIHRHTITVRSKNDPNLPFLYSNPAGRRGFETPPETLPGTHHHQHAVLHSKTTRHEGDEVWPVSSFFFFFFYLQCVCVHVFAF